MKVSTVVDYLAPIAFVGALLIGRRIKFDPVLR